LSFCKLNANKNLKSGVSTNNIHYNAHA